MDLYTLIGERHIVEVPVGGHRHHKQRGNRFSQRAVERGLEQVGAGGEHASTLTGGPTDVLKALALAVFEHEHTGTIQLVAG